MGLKVGLLLLALASPDGSTGETYRLEATVLAAAGGVQASESYRSRSLTGARPPDVFRVPARRAVAPPVSGGLRSLVGGSSLVPSGRDVRVRSRPEGAVNLRVVLACDTQPIRRAIGRLPLPWTSLRALLAGPECGSRGVSCCEP